LFKYKREPISELRGIKTQQTTDPGLEYLSVVLTRIYSGDVSYLKIDNLFDFDNISA
jgi:hypothetical protein